MFNIRTSLMTMYTVGTGAANSLFGVALPEATIVTQTLPEVMTQVAADVGLAKDTAEVIDESVPGGVEHLRKGEWEPIRDPLDQLVEVGADEQETETEIRKQQLQQDIEVQADQDVRGAVVSGPERSDPNWEDSRARADRFGQALDEQFGPQDMAPEQRLKDANMRLSEAERTERAIATDPRSSDGDRLSARFDTAEAQVELIDAQSGWDLADFNRRVALRDSELAHAWSKEQRGLSAPDVFRDQAEADVLSSRGAPPQTHEPMTPQKEGELPVPERAGTAQFPPAPSRNQPSVSGHRDEFGRGNAEELRPVVIGEDQRRVEYAARKFDSEPYPGLTVAAAHQPEGSTKLERLRLEHNEAWLRQAMSEGRRVIDTGPAEAKVDYPEPTRGAHGERTDDYRTYRNEAAYEMERRVSEGCGNIIRPYEDMSHVPWKDSQAEWHVRPARLDVPQGEAWTLDEAAREALRARGVDPDTVKPRPWSLQPNVEWTIAHPEQVPKEAYEGGFAEDGGLAETPLAVRLFDARFSDAAAVQGMSVEALDARRQIQQALARGEDVTLYRLKEQGHERPYGEQMWNFEEPRRKAGDAVEVETRKLRPGDRYVTAGYFPDSPHLDVEVAVAERRLAAPIYEPGSGSGAAPVHDPGSGHDARSGSTGPPPTSSATDETTSQSTEQAAQPKRQNEQAAQATDQAAQARAGQEQAAQAKAQQERAAQAKAQNEKPQAREQAAQAKAQQERAAQAKTQQERAAQAKTQQERAAQAKTQQERAAQAKTQQERAAQAKTQPERAGTRGGHQREAKQREAQQRRSSAQPERPKKQQEASHAPRPK